MVNKLPPSVFEETITSDDNPDALISIYEFAAKAYDKGERADPDSVTNSDRFHLCLACIHHERSLSADVRSAIIGAAITQFREDAEVIVGRDAKTGNSLF